MKPETLSQKIYRWQADHPESPSLFDNIHSFIKFRTVRSYDEYQPTKASHSPSFEKRLLNWISNVDKDHVQQILFRFVPKIFFVGHEEFTSLYISAIEECITPWLIDINQIDIFSKDMSEQIDQAKNRTWFCPITDSMVISEFCHVNHLTGNSDRPDWRSLSKFTDDKTKIVDYIRNNSIDQIVLLEDFIGSGGQVLGKDAFGIKGAIPFLCELLSENPDLNLNALIVPLIIYEIGLNNITQHIRKNHNTPDQIHVAPVLTLPKSLFLHQKTSENAEIFDVVESMTKYNFYYGPFGYDDTGSTVVMYTNCPDNTLSMIHETLDNWAPLFPRVSREKIN